jgi:hypothetical protein
MPKRRLYMLSATKTKEGDKMTKIKSRYESLKADSPNIEKLLGKAHSSYDGLVILRGRVAAAGVQMNMLPEDFILKAFALLGDHQREDVINRVSPYLALLSGKGFIVDANRIEGISTPELRFYSQIAHLLEDLLDITERFDAGIAALQQGAVSIGGPIIQCAREASGLFGQEMRIRAHIHDAEWLLIRIDPIFGFTDRLQRIAADTPIEIELPCDDGKVEICAMTASGRVSMHSLRLSNQTEAII